MQIIKDTSRKGIDLDKHTKKALTGLALDNDMNLKNFIEAQLIAMGKQGVTYIDLWHQCEALTAQLKALSK